MPQAFKYRGPHSAVTLKLPDGGERDLLLRTGTVYPDLPADHPYIASLIDRKLLVPAGVPPKPEKPKREAA